MMIRTVLSLLLFSGAALAQGEARPASSHATAAEQADSANEAMRRSGAAKTVNVAVFVHEGVELLDFAGPAETLSGVQAPDGRRMLVYTVAQSRAPIVSQGILTVTPEYTFTDCPPPDVIVLPGGATGHAIANTDVVAWVRERAPKTRVVMSVCTGAFILGEAGLLDGGRATTHLGSIDRLRSAYPECEVLADVRVVDNGRVVTTAGISAGIDGALHVVAKLMGMPAAERRARYMEYEWTARFPIEPAPEPEPAADVADATGSYRCPPCDCEGCGEIVSAPGFCARCGMRLVAVDR